LLAAQCVLLAAMPGCTGSRVTLGVIPDANSSDSPPSNDLDAGADDGVPEAGDAASEAAAPATCFGTPEVVPGLATADDEENPTFTENAQEIYFSSNRPGGPGSTDVWHAIRNSDGTFAAPELVGNVNTSDPETSPAVSRDGLTLWLGRKVNETDTGHDIYWSTRTSLNDPWSPPQKDMVLSSNADDIPRPLGNRNCTMPLGSRRSTVSSDYLTYLADRTDCSGDFKTPVLISELSSPDRTTVDGFLTDDGLTLYFQRALIGAKGDLYVASRPSLQEGWSRPAALVSVNTPDDERDPWLDEQGGWLYFVSDRGGSSDIYRARVLDAVECLRD
jgi:hypothetical protein